MTIGKPYRTVCERCIELYGSVSGVKSLVLKGIYYVAPSYGHQFEIPCQPYELDMRNIDQYDSVLDAIMQDFGQIDTLGNI